MAHKRKKPDCIMAGMLAILTAFSPVVSVMPVYASSDNEMSTSVTIDQDSDTGGSVPDDDSGTSDVVIEDQTGSSDISITDDDGGGEGIVSEVIGDDSDGIDIEDTDDGISVENQQDTDDVVIDPDTVISDGIDIGQMDNSVSIDQITDSSVETRTLMFDFVGENGVVKITPNADSAVYGVHYIRVHKDSEGNRIASIYDENKCFLYSAEVSNYVSFYQDSLPEGSTYTVEAIADYGYSVGTYSILMDGGADDRTDVPEQTTFVSNHYQKYTWDVVMDSDKVMSVSFNNDNFDLEYENQIVIADVKSSMDAKDTDVLSDNSVSNDSVEGQASVVLSDESDDIDFGVISSMADEVEIPDISEKEEKQAIADPVYEGYIREHLNKNLVHGNDLGIVSYMHVKQTLFDMTNVPALVDADIDNLMIRDNVADYCAGQMETIVPLYLLNEDDEYLVAYVNTMQHDIRAKVFDWAFANANFDGEALPGCIYDKDTGLAYIPKEDAFESESIPLGKVQVQLAQAIDYNTSYIESVAIVDDPDGTLNVEGFNIYEDIPSFDIGSGRNPEDLEVFLNGIPLYADDDMWAYDPETGELFINQSSVLISSVNVRDSGEDVSFLGTAIKTLFGLKKVYASTWLGDWANMKSIGKIAPDGGSLKVGDTARMTGTLVRTPSDSGAYYPGVAERIAFYNYIPVSASPMVPNYHVVTDKFAYWITGGSNKIPADFKTPDKYYNYGYGSPDGQTNVESEMHHMSFFLQMSSLSAGASAAFEFEDVADKLDGNALLPLACAHVTHPLTGSALRPPNSNFPQTYTNAQFGMRVLAVNTDKKYAVIAILSQGVTSIGSTDPNDRGQCAFGVFRVEMEPVNSFLRVNKNVGTGGSLGGGCTDNPLYDMEGALFGVYKTKAGAANADVIENSKDTTRDKKGSPAACIGVLKSKNAAGITGYLDLSDCYNASTGKLEFAYEDGLWVRELKAPKGYARSDEIKHVPLPPRSNGKMITVIINDPPVNDPAVGEIIKVPEGTIAANMTKDELLAAAKANSEDMNGAQYSLKYYKCSSDANLSKLDPDVEATLQTVQVNGINGLLDFFNPKCYVGKCKVNGKATDSNWPYKTNNTYVFPLGMYVLEETKAPENYALKKGKMKVVGKCVRTTDSSGKNFGAKFSWLTGDDHGNNDGRIFTLNSYDHDLGIAYAYNEPSTAYNAGVYKVDEDANAAELGDRTFDGIKFGLIWGEENEGPMPNTFTKEEVKPGSQIPGLELTLKDGKNYVTTKELKNGKGCLAPGTYYWVETSGNDVYMKSENRLKVVIPKTGKAGAVYWPSKDGNPVTDVLDEKGNLKTDDIEPFVNVSPPMGVSLDKTTWTNFGEMESDDYILGDATYEDYIFGKQDIGDATLEGHTFAIFHTSENDIKLKDDTIVKSAKNKLENPEKPTWKELNDLYELTDGKIQENGYICGIIVTDAKGEAKTAPDAFSIGKYWVIEVATKEDYVVNNIDVGQVGPVKADMLTEDGGLIKATFKHNGEIADDGACWNPPVSGGAHIQKLDLMRDDDREHGDTNLAATFKIVNASKKAVKNKYGETIPTSGLTDDPDLPSYDQVRLASETCTVYEITADANGKADTEEHDLVYGTYYVIETAVPDGYYLNTDWVGKIVIREDGVMVPVCDSNNELHDEYNHWYYDRSQKEPVVHEDDKVACRDQIYRGGIAVQKIDKEMGWQTAQGMSTLKGAEFTILNASKSSVRNADGHDVKSVTSRKDFQATYQQLWRIANESESPYVMQRIYTNKEGFASTDKFDLPYGTYYVIETKAPIGYWVDETFVGKIVIRDDGRCMMISDSDLPTANGSDFYDINDESSDRKNVVDDQVRRCDLYFRKVDIDGNPKANIPFMISAIRRDDGGRETILESHVIVSDSNGIVTTSSKDIVVDVGGSRVTYPGRAHGNHTNGMDQYVQNNTVLPDGEQFLKNGDASRWGVWFQGNANSSPKNAITESYGALYPGWYRITEIHCEDNKNLEENLVESELIWIDNDKGNLSDMMSKKDPDNNKLVTHTPLVDARTIIRSLALDVESHSKTVPVRDSVEVSDSIELEHVSADHKYRWATQFRDMSDGGKVIKILGTNTEDATVSDDGLWVEREFYPTPKLGTNNTFEKETVSAFINTSALRGHTIMAYSFLYEWIDVTSKDDVSGDWILINIHPKSGETEPSQELYVPDLKTTASDKYSGDRVGTKREDDIILDTVQYSGLSTGVVYGIFMDVVDAKTGKSLIDKKVGIDTRTGIIGRQNGQANTPFSGTVNMKEYVLDSSKFHGQSAVVVEKLYRVDMETGEPIGDAILTHDSLLDENQTIRWPDVHTTASDQNTLIDVGTDEPKAVIYDKVELKNLIFDDDDHEGPYSYILRGKLVYQRDFIDKDGVEHKAGDEIPTLNGTFNAVKITSDAAGNITMKYIDYVDIDDVNDNGDYRDDDEDHKWDDIDAEGQITWKRFGYNRSDKVNPSDVWDNTYIVDETSMICDLWVNMKFKLNAMDLEGGSAVVFERLYHDADGACVNEVANHIDLTDENQTIHYPKVRTTAVEKSTTDDVGKVSHKMTVVDTVELTNLVVGREYTVVGKLKDQDTGEDFLVNGQPITQKAFIRVNHEGEIENTGGSNVVVTEHDVVNNMVSGTIDLTFEFDSTSMEGKTCVVFEDLMCLGVRVATHSDINDISQSVHIPKIRTTNTDGYTKDHVATVTDHIDHEVAIINDEVRYQNLVIGKEYTINGVLMNKDTGEPIVDVDGNEVRSSHTFIAGETSDVVTITKQDDVKNRVDGTCTITFTFDGALMEGVTAVAFEDLEHNGITVTTHAYIEDEAQTVHFPKIRTSILDNNTEDEVGVVGETTITDTVRFWNLIPGMEYNVRGVLMDKATGKPILVNGEEVVSTAKVKIREDGTVDGSCTPECDCGEIDTCKCDHSAVRVIRFDEKNNRVDGWVTLKFTFDASGLEGKDVVAFEYLYHNGVKVAWHTDINDLGQTIHFPKIRTQAIDTDTGDRAGTIGKDVQVTDTISYTNLVIGKKYTVKGILMNQETNTPIINSDGKYVESEATFVITRDGGEDNKVLRVNEDDHSVDGEFTLRFNLDSRQLINESVVAFEDLYHNGVKVTSHADIRDLAQTVHYPDIHTTAVDQETGDHVGSIFGDWINAIRNLFGDNINHDKKQTIVDTVTLNNLVPGLTYVVSGKIYNVSESLKAGYDVPLLIDNKEIVQTAVITVAEDGSAIISGNGERTEVLRYRPELGRVDGTVDLTYSLDSSKIQGVEIVVFEDLYQDVSYRPDSVITLDEKDIIHRHEDINDKNQSVSNVRIHTVAQETNTADNVGVVPTEGRDSRIRDEISLEKLVPKEDYAIRGYLVNIDESDFANGIVRYLKQDGTLTENKAEAYSEIIGFTAEEPDETHYMTFDVKSDKVAGMRLTVYEELYHHWVADNGDEHVAKISMHPQDPYGWDQSWSEDAISETVYYPDIETEAIDADTGDHVGTEADSTVFIDTVKYTNLVIGREYTLRGTLMNQDSGRPILDTDGRAITAETTFIAGRESTDDNKVTEVNEKSKHVSGEYKLRFVFDTRLLAGNSAVAFEELYHNELKVCAHTDLYDDAQTVHYPLIHTSARDKDTGDHVGSIWGALMNGAKKFFGDKDVDDNGIPDDKQQTILDTVTLENLVPGNTYIITGKLYDKTDSLEAGVAVPLFIDGEEVTNAVTITVSEDGQSIIASDGSETSVTGYSEDKNRVTGTVEMEFVFDGSKTTGKEMVVFEKLYHDSVYTPDTPPTPKEEDLIHEHANIDDLDQTVTDVDIHTIAVDAETKGHVGMVSDGDEESDGYSAIIDTVKLAKLVPGATYTVKGFLVDMKASDFDNQIPRYYKADGSTTENPEDAVSSQITFKAIKAEETHKLEFAVKSDKVQGKSITVFENLYHNDVLLATHPAYDGDDWNEQAIADQTVHYPTGKTNATDNTTGEHTSLADGKRTIVDRVYFENLLVGEEYAIHGKLHYQSDFVDADGVEHKAGDVVEGVPETAVKLVGHDKMTHAYYADGSGRTTPIIDLKVTTFMNRQKAVSGYVDLEFVVDASKLAGAKIVAFESFAYKGVDVFTHADIEDYPQTITIPKISTNAKSIELDEAAIKNADGTYRDIEITDTVTYENVWSVADLDAMTEEGKYIRYADGTYRAQDGSIYTIDENATYVVKGVLMNKETGEPIRDVKGNPYEVKSEPFVAYESNGTVDVVFVVNVGDLVDEDIDTLEGKSLVVFEDMYQTTSPDETPDDKKIAIHHDIDDEEQDIRFPRIRTHAVDGDEGSALGYHESEKASGVHEVYASENMTITDTVSFENLHYGEDYTITGTLQVVTEVDKDGKPIAWETAKDDDGNVITASKKFNTRDYPHDGDSVSGKVELTFTFSGLSLAGKTVVAFEELERKGVIVAIHADITDEPQTIFIPKIRTHASDLMTGLNEALASNKTFVLDEVTYENLEAGKTYTMKAVLHRKSDGSAIDGTAVSGTFIAGQENQYILPDSTHIGTIDEIRDLLASTVDDTDSDKDLDIEGKVEYVVGKDIPAGYYAITPGSDSGFGYWCIYYTEDGSVPEERTLETTLANGVVSGENMTDYIRVTDGMVLQLATWCDTQYAAVSAEEAFDNLDNTLFTYYQNIEAGFGFNDDQLVDDPDAETSVSGNQINLRGNGKRVNGSVFVVMPVDTKAIAGDAVVAFEQLWTPLDSDEGEKKIAIHEDLEDEDQTVTIPKISTSATINDDKTAVATDNMTVVDTVTYENLVPGRTYVLSGVLMDKETGLSTDITSNMTFVPDTPDGSVELEFVFDGTKLVGKQLVVFESLGRLMDSGEIRIVAEHKDIDDAAQTVSLQSPPIDEENPNPIIDAGDIAMKGYIIAFAVMAGLMLVLFVVRRKTNE